MSLLRTAGRVAVASSVHGRVQRRQHERWSAQDQAAAQQVPVQQVPVQAVAPPPAQDPMSRKLSQLTQLAELMEAGVLSTAEFEAKKALILHG
ncbi:MAG: SHOCT domain-containing protein [Ruaniaceae bacterium]|nr:SHOCT domain-containing protein [Ruaniaceae bacterium]